MPRFLGRSQAGERVNRKVRAPMLSLQDDPRFGAGLGLVAAQVASRVPVAGHLAVQREADRVEHAGLARAGVTGEQEHATCGEVVEVDVHGLDERPERRAESSVEPHRRARPEELGHQVVVVGAAGEGLVEQRGLGIGRRAAADVVDEGERDRRAPSLPSVGHARVARRSPPVGAKRRARACGNRARSRSIAAAGRAGSVSVACTHAVSAAASAGSASRLSRLPSRRASARGTGASTKVVAPTPWAPSSTSQEPLRWPASEKE